MARKVPKFVLARKRLYAEAFRDAGYDKQAAHLEECSELELLLACSHCSHRQYVVYHCQSRICPICSYWQSVERSHFIEKLLGKMEYPKMLTLTIPLTDRSPREAIQYLRKCFQQLRDRKVFDSVKGGAYQIEVKVKKGHFHVHMHVIMDSPYIHISKLYKAWENITQTPGVQIDVRAAKTKAQRAYIVKYTQKSAELRADGSDVVAWWEAVRGSRLFGTFGEWFNTKIEDLLEPDEFKPEPPACGGCGAVGSMYFARDGFFLFGKDWDEVKGFVINREWPESRPYTPPEPSADLGDQIELALFEVKDQSPAVRKAAETEKFNLEVPF